MAIITISRQVAALGDELATALAKKMGYHFVDRNLLEAKIVELGFPEEKLPKYDEKKPGFFASLAKDRDEYLDYLQTAVFECALGGNCILIGRGSFFILAPLPNVFSVRLVARDDVRIKRLMNEFSWDEKKALQRIQESNNNRIGFHKSFFNINNEDPSFFHLTFNMGIIDVETAAITVENVCKRIIGKTQEDRGAVKLAEMLDAQRLVNSLLFEYKINVNFLKASIDGDTVLLQGVADSSAFVEQAIHITEKIMPNRKVESCISIVQDFKAYP